jgi:hypothetical protein
MTESYHQIYEELVQCQHHGLTKTVWQDHAWTREEKEATLVLQCAGGGNFSYCKYRVQPRLDEKHPDFPIASEVATLMLVSTKCDKNHEVPVPPRREPRILQEMNLNSIGPCPDCGEAVALHSLLRRRADV